MLPLRCLALVPLGLSVPPALWAGLERRGLRGVRGMRSRYCLFQPSRRKKGTHQEKLLKPHSPVFRNLGNQPIDLALLV